MLVPPLITDCPLARYLNARNGHAGQGARVDRDSYALAGGRYPLPPWAQYFVARVDHAPARWKRPAAQGLTAAEALRLLEGLCDNGGDGSGRQEAQDGCAGPATRDDGQDVPHAGDDPDDGGAAVCGQDGTPPWLSWPLLSLPVDGARSGACRTASISL